MSTATIDSDMTNTPKPDAPTRNAATPEAARLSYDPPGPGAWSRDVDHQSAPRGVLMQELFTPNFVTGTQQCFARYGMPLDRLDGRHVHGWFYTRAVPAGVPDTGKAPPPAPVLRVLVRLAPELRRRHRTATETVEQARWLIDARQWADERANWIDRIEALLSTDLGVLDDVALTEQVRQALILSGDMIRRHFTLVGTSVAVGRLIANGQRWGLTPGDLVPALRGSSPSSSASRAPLTELAELVADRHDLCTADDLRAVSPRAAQLVDGYLSDYGWRPLAADVEAPTLAEHPDRLVDLVRAQRAATVRGAQVDPFDELRQRVPAGDRSEFDRLVEEARECYASLDDNSGITASTIGALRRVLLEVGRRGEQRAALGRIDDVFNLTPEEVQLLASGGSAAAPAVLAERRQQRIAAALQPPPPVIGGPVAPPPDPSVFPGALRELAAAVGAYLGLKFTAAPDAPRPVLTGSLTVEGQAPVLAVAVVAGTVRGRIVVSNDPADALNRIEPGDILVCPYTTAAHNAIFPLLGGVVTQFGGPLGHTAVMAREFDIPAAVGAGTLPLHLDGLQGELAVDLPA